MGQTETEIYASGMYNRVKNKWMSHRGQIFKGACGFGILGNPPIYQPKWMIVGENPGFGAKDFEPYVPCTWPSLSEAANADWPLAKKLPSIFSYGATPSIVKNAQLTNFQFFKSGSVKRDNRFCWNSLPSALTKELERFCLDELFGFVNVSRPSAILVLGIATFDKRAKDSTEILRDSKGKRRLLLKGRVFGIPAIGILHPTGARVANEDWIRVARYMAENTSI